MSDLIDTTEMYLRTIFELEEEGITALRARIAERLGHSGPTVSQTVARMERDGLLHVAGDDYLLTLTPLPPERTPIRARSREAMRSPSGPRSTAAGRTLFIEFSKADVPVVAAAGNDGFCVSEFDRETKPGTPVK